MEKPLRKQRLFFVAKITGFSFSLDRVCVGAHMEFQAGTHME